MSGKSTFIASCIKHREEVFQASFHRIIYAYPRQEESAYLAKYMENLRQEFQMLEECRGLPKLGTLNLTGNENDKLIILDDLSRQLFKDESMVELFSRIRY